MNNFMVVTAAIASLLFAPRPFAPPAQSAHIDWDTRTLTLIQRGAGYGRMARLRTGEVECVFEWQGGVWLRQSRDEGKTWQEPVLVGAWASGVLANPEVLPLRNGSQLVFSNGRPHRSSSEAVSPPRFTIFVSRSDDAGKTWSPPSSVYEAGAEFQNGCWEPAGVQMPNGEVHLFFANEGPYTRSDEQEITRLVSRDSGRTWGKPEAVSFRAGHRDGMPVPLLLQKGVVLAIEDNGLSGNFKPALVSPAPPGKNVLPVSGGDARRWNPLQTPLAPGVYAGAPYLRGLPSGETVLSFQQGDDGKMDGARMAVVLGDKQARNFAALSYPFAVDGAKKGDSQLWNALFVKNPDTVTAISSTAINGVGGVWAIDGKVVRKR